MRKVLISLAAAATTIAFATPAAAQYYQPQGFGYNGYNYGNGGYGHGGYGNRGYGNRGYDNGAINTLQRRINNVERSLGGVRRDQVGQIAAEANALERRLHVAARNGLSGYEAHALDMQVGRLEQRLQWASVNRGYERYDGHRGRW